jgi:hypothetical protein
MIAKLFIINSEIIYYMNNLTFQQSVDFPQSPKVDSTELKIMVKISHFYLRVSHRRGCKETHRHTSQPYA